jgi:invasin D
VGALEEIFIARDDVSPLGLSEQDLFDKIKAMLGNLESEYLAYYQDAITKFTEYFDKIREALNKITSNATDSGEHVDFKNNGAKAALDSIVRAAWSVASFESKAEADKLGATLAPAFKVTQVGDKWEVHIDTSQASALRDQMPPDAKISNVAFNTWTNKRESSVASLNTAAQATAEAFSRANSTYDNLVKLLSSLIESMMKMMEGFLPT